VVVLRALLGGWIGARATRSAATLSFNQARRDEDETWRIALYNECWYNISLSREVVSDLQTQQGAGLPSQTTEPACDESVSMGNVLYHGDNLDVLGQTRRTSRGDRRLPLGTPWRPNNRSMLYRASMLESMREFWKSTQPTRHRRLFPGTSKQRHDWLRCLLSAGRSRTEGRV
jgi:hypothetical protein